MKVIINPENKEVIIDGENTTILLTEMLTFEYGKYDDWRLTLKNLSLENSGDDKTTD